MATPTFPSRRPDTNTARARRYVEAMGSTQVMNTYLKLTVLGLAVVGRRARPPERAHAAHVPDLKPLVIPD